MPVPMMPAAKNAKATFPATGRRASATCAEVSMCSVCVERCGGRDHDRQGVDIG